MNQTTVNSSSTRRISDRTKRRRVAGTSSGMAPRSPGLIDVERRSVEDFRHYRRRVAAPHLAFRAYDHAVRQSEGDHLFDIVGKHVVPAADGGKSLRRLVERQRAAWAGPDG